MRPRRAPDDVAEVARRRLELLSAELAEIRPGPMDPPSPVVRGGSGELPDDEPDPDWSHREWRGQVLPAGTSAQGRPSHDQVGPAPSARPSQARSSSAGTGRHRRDRAQPMSTAAAWVQDRLPATLQGRVAMSGAHLGVVVILVAVGLCLTAWWVVRASGGDVSSVPDARAGYPSATQSGTPAGLVPASSFASSTSSPVPSSAASAGSTPPWATTSSGASGFPAGTQSGSAMATGAAGTGTAAGSATDTGEVVVDVMGKVRHPGIATLPVGSRVVDALQAVGGARRGVSLRALNLARVLVDGEQIAVGVPVPSGAAASALAGAASGASGTATSSAAPAMVDINTADLITLETLPEVGPVTAQSILDYRTQIGSFSSVDQLLEVSGIGDATLAKIAPYCTV